MHRVRVGGGMHCDRRNSKLTAGALNTQRDFASIRDQDFLKQLGTLINDHQEFSVFDGRAILNIDPRYGARAR